MSDSTNLPKKYVFKSYTSAGVFLGVIQNVISKFNYNQLINTAFVQTTILVGQSADTASDNVDFLETENNLPITTEAVANLTTERTPDLVGAANSNALIANDRLIEVWEYSRYNPTGKLVFSGYIAKWKTAFGGSENIEVTCLSKGTELENFLVPGGTADTLDQSQTTKGVGDDTGFWATRRYGQTFQTGSGVTNLSAVILNLSAGSAGARTFTLKLWNSIADATTSGTPLGSATLVLAAGTALSDQTFTFGTPVAVTANTPYFLSIEVDSGSVFGDSTTWGGFDGKASTNPYANGTAYRSDSGGAWGNSTLSGYDLYFKTYYSANSTKKTYTSSDVATILNSIMDYYVSSGGSVAKSGTYAATGKTATYTFNINTTLEGIQKIFELGPSNYYWYVDPATNTLYYQAAAVAAAHYMIKGRHMAELDIEATKEYIVNIVYFTGGDDGTGTSTNVYVTLNSATSLVNNRRGLARVNDPKVTGTTGAATGRVLAQNVIDQNAAETYITEVVVVDDTYDISLFTMGQMVAFEGFGTFVDRLLLQIVGIRREEDKVTLSLGTLRKRSTAQVEDIQSSLEASQTVANPTSPS